MKQHKWTLARAGDEIGYPTIKVDIDNDIQIRLPDEEQARLVAASPDMYEVLKAVESSIIRNGDNSISYAIDHKISKQIREALNKAEGK
jgi:hypothetical protein